MKVTTQMVEAAMKKATEAGLLPRHARHEDVLINQELIRAVLQSAMEAAPGAAVIVNQAGAHPPAASATDLEALSRKRPFSPLGMRRLLVSFPL